MSQRVSVSEIKEASDKLTELLKDAKEVQVIFRHVSASGLTRWLDLAVAKGDEVIRFGYSASLLLGWSYSGEHNGIKVEGAGMDMGFHLVSSLSRRLFGDDYRLSHRWL